MNRIITALSVLLGRVATTDVIVGHLQNTITSLEARQTIIGKARARRDETIRALRAEAARLREQNLVEEDEGQRAARVADRIRTLIEA